MARIVYGVSGEGSGHASRARPVAQHLLDQGHEVKLVSYDRGYRYLARDFDVFETEGLEIVSEDNEVSVRKTLTENFGKLLEGSRKVRALRHGVFKTFQPHCVITDFEPMTAYLARHYDLPLISLDNQHDMRYLEYECPDYLRKERLITEAIVKAMVPKPHVSLVISFHKGQPENNHTFVYPPILKEDVLNLDPTEGDWTLIYLTAGFESFLDILKQFPRERFLVYGYDREAVDGPLHFRPFSKTGFLDDLAGCGAVMATAGFTLMGEAFHLKKPYLALPMKGQFEQELNAWRMERLGYGMCLREPNPHAVGHFLYRLPEYRQALEGYRTSDGGEIMTKLDELLANDLKLLKQYAS